MLHTSNDSLGDVMKFCGRDCSLQENGLVGKLSSAHTRARTHARHHLVSQEEVLIRQKLAVVSLTTLKTELLLGCMERTEKSCMVREWRSGCSGPCITCSHDCVHLQTRVTDAYACGRSDAHVPWPFRRLLARRHRHTSRRFHHHHQMNR
jgi:hypothetical protein